MHIIFRIVAIVSLLTTVVVVGICAIPGLDPFGVALGLTIASYGVANVVLCETFYHFAPRRA